MYLGHGPVVVAVAAGCGAGILALVASWAVGWVVGRGVAKLKVLDYKTFENSDITDRDL